MLSNYVFQRKCFKTTYWNVKIFLYLNKCLNWRKRKRFFLLGCCQLLVQGVFAGTKLFVFELTTASSSACCCWHPSNLKILLFTVMMSYFNSIFISWPVTRRFYQTLVFNLFWLEESWKW